MERGEQVSLHCIGFQTVYARACEYAATGKVNVSLSERGKLIPMGAARLRITAFPSVDVTQYPSSSSVTLPRNIR